MNKKLTMLMILDGYGVNENEKANAVKIANTPNLDMLFKTYPNTLISTSGIDVGLPEGQMGNSEVGHTNIGAGRVVYQELTRITKSISDGDFFENKELLDGINNCKKYNTNMHIYGLLSDGGVHSHNTHLYAILEMCKKNDFSNVFVHAFLDGRDTPPASGEKYLLELQEKMDEIGVGKIASIMGRYYAMDRDNRWERVELAYNALVKGEGDKANSVTSAIENSYQIEVFDEFVKPTIICENETELPRIKENDSIIFFNFRPDRAREITRCFVDKNFNGFEREYFNVNYTCFTQYDETMPNVKVAFKPQTLVNTYGEYISNNGLKQLRIAETEKYAHVTFFFNGGEEKTYENEDRILVNSPKVATYDLKPEMSAYEVKDKVIEAIKEQKYDSIILNFANCDMVGHTGSLDAAVKAVETVDKCVGEIVEEINKINGALLITADHGNAEQMIDYSTGEMHTAHTTNKVPLILVGIDNVKLNSGRLCDLAPTMLYILGLDKPQEMTGSNLIEEI
ncbi:MAG: 2,3-bisphosphoglycerate-independent phosphoglycerate mutase [Clostridiales bacterium]|nr:2,3-bisphosphoglycerate-independent phosphoglycerate mutase [Clostridiales bacterium]